METKEKEKRLAALNEKPNNPLMLSLVLSILTGVVVCCLIAQEAAEKGTKSEFANYIFFSLLFLAAGIVLIWKQIQRIDRKLEAITDLVSDQIEETDEDEEDDEEDDDEDEEEDEEDNDAEVEEEEKNGKNSSEDK